MPLIVDANVAADTFLGRSADFAPVLKALMTGKARMIYGGQLTEEYSCNKAVRRIVVLLDQAGVAKALPDKAVTTRAKQLAQHCVSNDCHIIALAQLGGARLLCSLDTDLHKDFCNRQLLSPRGKIYKNPSHAALLRVLGP